MDVSARTARLRERERPPGDALDLARVVLAGIEDRAVVAHAARAKVEPADELAHDEQIHVAPHGRPQVRVRVQRSAQAQQSLLGPHVRCVEFGVADRALEDRGRVAAGRERLPGQRISGRANGGGTDEPLRDLDVGGDELENEPRLARRPPARLRRRAGARQQA